MAVDIDNLVDQLATKTGHDPSVVRKAVGIIANFIAREAPAATAQALFDKLPGVRGLADAQAGPTGGLMGIFNDLIGAGLSMSDVPAITLAFVDFAKANGAEREVGDVIAAIPGLAQFV